MNKLLANTVGVITDGDNWIEVLLEDTAPRKSIGGVGQKYIYIIKYDHTGRVGRRSIGLPADKALLLGRSLVDALTVPPKDNHEHE